MITGETGAGKSILVDALGLLRGGRAGTDLIRTGRDEAQVEAIFEVPAGSPVRARLAATGATSGRDEGLVVRRMIARTGAGAPTWAAAWPPRRELARSVGSWSTSPRSTTSSR